MTISQFAMVFPGQGSQTVGMLRALAENYPLVEKTFAAASEVLGYDLWQLTQQGPAEKLNQTEFTQPALLVSEYAMWQCWLQENGAAPSILAGHSLGEYSALLCADALSFADAVDLVAARGCFMQQAVQAGEGAMAAVIGLDDEALAELCEEAKLSDEVLSPANFNSVGQTVVAGHAASVDKAVEMAKSKGAKLAKRIPVSVPSHCELMRSAAEQLAEKIKKINFKMPNIAVIQNVDAKNHETTDEIKQALISQLVSPVQWVKTVLVIEKQNIKTLVECGPGKVLAGLNKRISRDVATLNFSDQSTLSEVIKNI